MLIKKLFELKWLCAQNKKDCQAHNDNQAMHVPKVKYLNEFLKINFYFNKTWESIFFTKMNYT